MTDQIKKGDIIDPEFPNYISYQAYTLEDIERMDRGEETPLKKEKIICHGRILNERLEFYTFEATETHFNINLLNLHTAGETAEAFEALAKWLRKRKNKYVFDGFHD